MWISKNKWDMIEKRMDDLEETIQGQQEMLKTCLAPPVGNCIRGSGDTALNRYHQCRNAGLYGGGGINYEGLTIETLRDINQSITMISSIVKDGFIPVKVELK